MRSGALAAVVFGLAALGAPGLKSRPIASPGARLYAVARESCVGLTSSTPPHRLVSWQSASGCPVLMYIVGCGLSLVSVVSSSPESLWSVSQSLAWSEREATEMLGVVFFGSRDSRSIYSYPTLAPTPLRRSFPLGGFYEVFTCPTRAGLAWRRSQVA